MHTKQQKDIEGGGMRRITKKLLTVMLAICVAGTVGFSLDTSDSYAAGTVKAKSVKLNYTKYTLKKGKTVKLKASISPKNATQKKIVWTTSNKKIATVKNGKVKAVGKKGKVTITATVKGTKKKAKATIYIGTPVQKAVFATSAISMVKGEKRTVAAKLTPAKATLKGIAYSSSDPSVATVSSSGVITAVRAGTALITAAPKDEAGKKAKLTVTVTEPVKPDEKENAEPAMTVAMITDFGDITDQSYNQVTYAAVKAFCEDNDITFTYKRPGSDSDSARIARIKEAINEGYNVIVMPGYAFANAVYQTAPLFPDIKFIALDISEDDFSGNGEREFDLSGKYNNVYSAVYQEEVAGYMAGYAAVKLGCNKLGFLGGMPVPAVQRYGYGFIQGADAAAADLDRSDIEIRFAYGGQFFGDDEITAAMDRWFDEGTQCVFACGGAIFMSAAEAAEKKDGRVIGVDVDQSGFIDAIYGEGRTLTSATKGLATTVTTLLGAIKDGRWGDYKGQVQTLGIVSDDPAVNYVQLAASTRFGNGFTYDEYKTLTAQIHCGAKTVSANTDDLPQTTKANVIDEGMLKD